MEVIGVVEVFVREERGVRRGDNRSSLPLGRPELYPSFSEDDGELFPQNIFYFDLSAVLLGCLPS